MELPLPKQARVMSGNIFTVFLPGTISLIQLIGYTEHEFYHVRNFMRKINPSCKNYNRTSNSCINL
jgi:hypothetical protein